MSVVSISSTRGIPAVSAQRQTRGVLTVLLLGILLASRAKLLFSWILGLPSALAAKPTSPTA